MIICEHNSLKRSCPHCELNEVYVEIDVLGAEVVALQSENARLRAALERMDDRKNPMLPRSEMARIAKEALDNTEVTADATREETEG